MTVITYNLNWVKNEWAGIMEADAKGYYAYLPALIIYQDPNFEFFHAIEEQKYYNKDLFYDYRYIIGDIWINKYYCGTALLEMPFFLIAHFLSFLLDYEMDGYSKLYQGFISIAAIFYLLTGLVLLNRFLTRFEIKENIRILILITTVFGTNLFYYSVCEPGMSHVYSFAMVAFFLNYSKRYHDSQEKWLIPIILISLGMIILMRPVNGLIMLLLPFLYSSKKKFLERFKTMWHSKKHLILGFFGFTTIISLQLIYYKIATGNFFVYSYGEEGFHFSEPHIFDFLFSYKKGLFVYTPIFGLSLIGLHYLRQHSFYQFIGFSAFFILLVYISSSWWQWYYGGSFSTRVFIEFIPIFMLLLAFAIQHAKHGIQKFLICGAVIFLIILCQLQTYFLQILYHSLVGYDPGKILE